MVETLDDIINVPPDSPDRKCPGELRDRLVLIEHKLDVLSHRLFGPRPAPPGALNEMHWGPRAPPLGIIESMSRPNVVEVSGEDESEEFSNSARFANSCSREFLSDMGDDEENGLWKKSCRTGTNPADASTPTNFTKRSAWEEKAFEHTNPVQKRRSVSWVSKKSTVFSTRTQVLTWCLTCCAIPRLFNCRDWCKMRTGIRSSRDIPESAPFEALSSVVILCNAVFIGYCASWNLHANAYGTELPGFLDQIHLAFCILFTLEVIVKLICERTYFFTGDDNRWNMLDVLLAGVAIMDVIAQEGSNFAGSVSRVLRMCRFLRLVRLTRVMKRLKAMRIVVYAILGSLMSIFWSLVIICFIMYIFAVVAMYGTAEYFAETGLQEDDKVGKDLIKMYGGTYKSMSALFMAISGGDDWMNFMLPLAEIHPAFGPMFLAYIFFMYFGVLNVVVGTFVAHSVDVAAKDKEEIVKNEMNQLADYARMVRDFFVEADSDSSGTLTWEEFEVHMQDKRVKAYFQALQLDISQAHHLFELLDSDGSNEVTIDEFLKGCLRLKGQARNIDLNLLMLRNEKLSDLIHSFMRQSTTDFQNLKKSLGIRDRHGSKDRKGLQMDKARGGVQSAHSLTLR